MLADVARVTRACAVDAQSLVKEQLLAKRYLFGRHGIVSRDRHRVVTREAGGTQGGKRLSFWGNRCRSAGNRDRVLTATNECKYDQQETNFSVDHKMLLTLVLAKCLDGFSSSHY